MKKYKAIVDIASKGWETEPYEIKSGDVLESRNWHRINTLMFGDKAVCDEDSQMCAKEFELITE